MFNIKNIVKHYVRGSDRVKAVDDVSFDIRPGEILAFLGLNGAAKTTGIKIIAGLVEADSGSIETAEGQQAGALLYLAVGYLLFSASVLRTRRLGNLAQY